MSRNVDRAIELWRSNVGPDEIHELTGIGIEVLRDALAERRLIPPPAIDADHLDRIADALSNGQAIPESARRWLLSRPWKRN